MLHFLRSVRILDYLSIRNCKFIKLMHLKGLSHEIDFKNVDENGHGWLLNFSETPLIFS
jgi:hypothetical protein